MRRGYGKKGNGNGRCGFGRGAGRAFRRRTMGSGMCEIPSMMRPEPSGDYEETGQTERRGAGRGFGGGRGFGRRAGHGGFRNGNAKRDD